MSPALKADWLVNTEYVPEHGILSCSDYFGKSTGEVFLSKILTLLICFKDKIEHCKIWFKFVRAPAIYITVIYFSTGNITKSEMNLICLLLFSWTQVTKVDEFFSLSHCQLLELISQDSLKVLCESEVCDNINTIHFLIP